ncbi:MAG: sugar MFS transporter [Flavobacteriaceae bacterium]|jgi:glucose/galactose transporter|nr:sugar MFS transporter [Flavobacteriaceae bacterium]
MTKASKNDYSSAMWIIGILFFIFGFVTWLNGPLITFVKLAFNLDTDSKAFWVTTAFYMAYFFLALPSSWILEKIGMKKGMAVGLLIMAVGTFIFGTFATQRRYLICLTGLFTIGSGLSLLQTASNPYISIIGPIETAAKRITVMGICNKVAGILSPIILSYFVLKDIDKLPDRVNAATSEVQKETILNDFASQIYIPYMVMAVILVLLAFWILRSKLPDIKTSENNSTAEGGSTTKTSIFQFPHLWLGVFCLFVYVGVEVFAGDGIVSYGADLGLIQGITIDFLNLSVPFTSITLFFMLLGYIIGLFTVPKVFSQEKALMFSAISGIIFTFASYLTTGYVSGIFIALLGLSNAIMWPAIFPLAIYSLGKFTEKGSALLIMGIVGGAIIPKVYAHLKEIFPFQNAMLLVVLPSYVYILFYAVAGCKIGLKKTKN